MSLADDITHGTYRLRTAVLSGSDVRIEEVLPELHRIVCHVGFMEQIDVPALVKEARRQFKALDVRTASDMRSRDDIDTSNRPGMMRVQKTLFAFMSRNSEVAKSHPGTPPEK